MKRVLHLTTHLNIGGITTYIQRLIKPLGNLGFEISVLSSGGELQDSLHKIPALTFELPIRTKNEIHPKIYTALPRLLHIIQSQKIDMLHAHTRVTQVLAFWAGKFAGIPVVTTCHGFYKRRLGRILLPAWGEKCIAISEGVGKYLVGDFKVPEEKVVTIHNGVDLEELDAAYVRHDPSKVRSLYGFKQTDIVVGIVARLVQDKGHEYLIQAAATLKKEIPDLKVLIVGDGKYRSHLEELSRKLDFADRIVFAGNISDVTYPLSAIDIFALPATWREGFGLSIIEAMVCRKPIIVTNIWALNTLIQNGVTGLMIEPKKVEPLAAAILTLIKEVPFRVHLAENGRMMVQKLFSIQQMAQDIANVYRSVLSR